MKKHLLLISLIALSVASLSAELPQRRTTTMKTMRSELRTHLGAPAKAAETGLALPYECTLGKNQVDGYTVIDANNDGRTWKPGGFTGYSVCMTPNTDDVDACDDWMLTPAIALESGKSYLVSFEAGMTLSKTEDLLEIMAGLEPEVASLTERVTPVINVPLNNKNFTPYEYTFTPTQGGNYYFGFHCLSLKSQSGTLKLCNFKIEETEAPVVVPDHAEEVPYSNTLGKNKVDNYIVVDADGDDKTWKPGGFTGYSVCMKPTAADITHNDDWLITVPLHLYAGKSYTISAEEGYTLSSGTADRSAFYIGTAPTVEAMTTEVIAPHDVTSRDFVPVSGDFTITNDGYYYIGIHCTSEKATSGNYKICNLSVAEYTKTIAPAAAGTLTYEIAPLGELKATLTYTAPTLDTNGDALDAISKVVITTNWAYKTELTDVVPGGTYTVEVDNLWQGDQNRFEAVAYIGDVAGEAVLIKNIFAGEDTPLSPENVKITLSEDYTKVILSWDAVGDVGEHGGWVDTENMVYYIFDAFGSYYDPAIGYTKETSFTIDFGDIKQQDFAAYQVTACVGDYNASLGTTSDIVVVGKPDALPFYESFSDCYYKQSWVVDPESSGQVFEGLFFDEELQTNTDADEGVEPTYLNSQDSDNGFYLMIPYEKDACYGFYSTKIDISNAQNPVFQLFYQGKGSVLELKVGADGATPTVVKSINLKENPTEDWTLASVDLSEYKTTRYIQVGLMIRGIHNTDSETWSVPIDNIRVIDQVAKNVRIISATAPAKVEAGEAASITVALENLGTETLENIELALTSGETSMTTTLDKLTIAGTAKQTFDIPTDVLSNDEIPFTIKANVEGDADTSDNTVIGLFAVQFPILPMPSGLTAVPGDGVIALSWDAPEYEGLKETKNVVEDFESEDYPVFTIDNFGDWTLVDYDGLPTYTFLRDVNNPYRTQPMAFQLFEPKKSGMPEDYYIDAVPASGERMLVAWSSQGQNDNWLISPALTGSAQTITFQAKSFTIAYAESFEVLYSTTDKSLKSFIKVESVENYPENGMVPEDWTEFKAALPEGAKYFAIRHTSYDTYALYVDDICFEASGEVPADLELLGYNTYLDGAAFGDLCTATNINLTFENSGKHSARVSSVYNHGESRACEAVEADVTVSGVENVATGISVELVGCQLTVKGSAGTPVAVYNAAGQLILKSVISASGTLTATISTGICVVNAGGHTAKLIAL